jgi:hypothetical protein
MCLPTRLELRRNVTSHDGEMARFTSNEVKTKFQDGRRRHFGN